MFHRLPRLAAPFALFRRLGAAGGIAVLLLLSASAASPALHHWLHADTGPDATDNCAVVLFASGLTLAVALVTVAGPSMRWSKLRLPPVREILLAAPRYLRLPERGPPGC